MNDKKWDKEKKRVRKILDYWIKKLGLSDHTIHINYETGSVRDEDSDGENYIVAAEVETRWEYLTATISIYPEITHTLTTQEIEHTIVHELCHILVAPMQERSSTKESEFVVERLAQRFISVSSKKK